MTTFERYRPPRLPWLDLAETPQLESFNGSDDPEQRALQAYLDRVERLLRPHLPDPESRISLGLAVGIGLSKALLEQRDLDNYLMPIARRIHHSGRRVLSAHAWKAHTDRSSVAVEPATRAAGTGRCQVK